MREHAEDVAASTRAQGAEALAVCAGLFLAISPWVVGFSSGFTPLLISNLILGLGYAVLMGGFGSAFERTHARAWAATAIGIWTMVAPWWTVGDLAHRRTIITNLVTGGLMTCLGLAAAGMVMTGLSLRRRGGGGGG